MSELAYNILWSWEPLIRSVFRRLDPALWRDCGYNPVLMLGRVSQVTLERAATDPRYMALYRSACDAYEARTRKHPATADVLDDVGVHVDGHAADDVDQP